MEQNETKGVVATTHPTRKQKLWTTAMCLYVNAWPEWEIEIVSIIEFISVWRAFLCCRLLPRIRMHHAESWATNECVCGLWMRKANGIKMNARKQTKNRKKRSVFMCRSVLVWAMWWSKKSRFEYNVFVGARTNVRCIYSVGNNDGVWHKWH